MTITTAEKKGIMILDEPPEGWRRPNSASGEPCGYEWWNNGMSRFGNDYRHALVRKKSDE